MFENLSTAIIQAIGFFAVFGLFVYQLLSDSNKGNIKRKKTINNKNSKEQIASKPSNKNSWFRRNPKIDKIEKPNKKKKWFG